MSMTEEGALLSARSSGSRRSRRSKHSSYSRFSRNSSFRNGAAGSPRSMFRTPSMLLREKHTSVSPKPRPPLKTHTTLQG